MESKETYSEIFDLFKERYNIDMKDINDYRPIPFSAEDKIKVGIKIWLENGDEINFIPKEWKELNKERIKNFHNGE